ncbi:MAG: hypothetical protein WC209_08355 [Ignavibacteriaceae bacterium]|jgi:hypothetical protein
MRNIKLIVFFYFITTIASFGQVKGSEPKDNDYSKYILILVGSFVGSTISYYFTRKKFQKEQLYLNKIETYKNLTDLLIDFNDKELFDPNIDSLFRKWSGLVSAINKAYLFLPEDFTLDIRAMVNSVNSKLMSYKKFKKELITNPKLEKTYYLHFYNMNPTIFEKAEWEPSDLFINIDIFSPFIEKYRYILDFLKYEIEKNWLNTVRHKIKYFKKNRENKVRKS